MAKMRWSSVIARSGLLAVVSSALAALIMLFVGSVVFSVRVRLGTADAEAGFEPNFFMRHVGLPASIMVLIVVFCMALRRLRKSDTTNSRTSGPASYPKT